MEHTESKDRAATALAPVDSPSGPGAITGAAAAPQTCPSCGTGSASSAETAASPTWIYAIGRIAPRFPKISVEKEFAQAVGRDKTDGLTDRKTLQAVLSKPENRYLVRQLCWVMTIEGLETYILLPRDPTDLNLLIEALRAAPQPSDLDCVIGVRGPIARPEMCNGLMIPVVVFDQIYSFDRDALIKAIPRPEKTPAKEFGAAAEELFDRIMQMTDNAGATDENRALNYLAVRHPRIYESAAEAFGRNESLTAVSVRPSALGGTRKVVDVVFSYTNRNTDVISKQAIRVDVSDEFLFLVSKLSPYYDH